ncbi:hypothetical protein ABZ646_42940 [Streptomyces sp. NPDC007162]|uniref:hypothetical protein n=1 Tax=Streptomyces sp. NPDC007162 TaxID=3156917 RepID=UPI0033C52A2E
MDHLRRHHPVELVHDVHTELLDLYLEDLHSDQDRLFQDETTAQEAYEPLLTRGWTADLGGSDLGDVVVGAQADRSGLGPGSGVAGRRACCRARVGEVPRGARVDGAGPGQMAGKDLHRLGRVEVRVPEFVVVGDAPVQLGGIAGELPGWPYSFVAALETGTTARQPTMSRVISKGWVITGTAPAEGCGTAG